MADEKIYTNIGHVTAYAYAKSKGYTGTEEQFATDQANFAANAQQVREDKESVEATVATFDNTTVPAAVQTVTAEGTRQVGIVGTAGDTQVARVQAEGTTQVGVVQTEGTTQKNAVQAKGDEVIASIPSDYTELTEEVEDLKSSIVDVNDYALNAYATDTASGAIATLPDGADDIPIKQLSVAIEPVQDLHGYDNPWPGGGGKNLFDKTTVGSDNKYITSAGGQITPSDSTQWRISDYIPVVPGQAYTISRMNGVGGSTPGCRFYSADKSEGITGASYLGASTKTVTAPENAYWLRISVTYDTLDIAQVELGSTATSYAPYSNICPISGHTECNVTRTGKNLLPTIVETTQGGLTFTQDGDYIDVTGTRTSSAYVYFMRNVILPAGRYTINGISGSSNATYRFGVKIGNANYAYVETNARSFESDGVTPWMVGLFVYTSYDHLKLQYQMEVGTVATEYEPYHSDTYPITFPSGTTVYGGNITVNQDGSGSLVVDMATADLGSLSWSKTTASGRWYFKANINDLLNQTSRTADLLCSSYMTISDGRSFGDCPDKCIYNISTSDTYGSIGVIDVSYETWESFSQAVVGVQLVYHLNAPITIPLTAPQITTLLGQNNLWADTGDVSVNYRADTALYISKKIAEALNA